MSTSSRNRRERPERSARPERPARSDTPAPAAGDGGDAASASPEPATSFALRPDLPPVAGLGRRIAGLCIDWAAALAVSAGFFGGDPLVTLGVFALMTWLLVGTLGATIGHVVVGLGVRRGAGTPPGPLRALVRTVLLCLVIPAVVWGPDGRGLHDVAAGTTITRIR